MEQPRKAMASTLVVWLLLVQSCLQVPCALGADDCWVLDRDRYRCCFRTAKCRAACAEDHFVDGRCKKGFPYLLPLCECLRPQCAAPSPSPQPERPATRSSDRSRRIARPRRVHSERGEDE
ncbi:unnamed protein product [Miscanthus lutarioriparius]|uniref:Uncharacterized protein n=1 Tax=Miscanthus lutarioriparius TaxID=422564 RepID=A0A811RXK6_9POAL|nr:unnamed protein product [Miscanthus lutarioriparius]CAD6342737.1 unnamed protein product [Miscanthus lutarioriparius]